MHRKPPVKGKAWQQFSFEERFNASFEINKETLCWEWIKPSSSGYGGIDYNSKTIAAHRASWLYHNGEIENSLCVLHKCDNRRCVNPDHLYLGNKKQNRKDFMERHPKAKELMNKASITGAAGVKRFWDNMNEDQKKAFCLKRKTIQQNKKETK